MVTALIIVCLVLIAVHISLEVVEIINARRHDMEELAQAFLEADEQAAITEANQKYDDQMFQWFAALANNTAQLAKELKRIADKLEQEPATPWSQGPETGSEPDASKAQERIEQGIQNILNYGFAQAIKRGDGN